MFTVDASTAAAVRRAFEDGGELAAIVELRRHFKAITDNEHARSCVRTILGWRADPAPDSAPDPNRPKG